MWNALQAIPPACAHWIRVEWLYIERNCLTLDFRKLRIPYPSEKIPLKKLGRTNRIHCSKISCWLVFAIRTLWVEHFVLIRITHNCSVRSAILKITHPFFEWSSMIKTGAWFPSWLFICMRTYVCRHNTNLHNNLSTLALRFGSSPALTRGAFSELCQSWVSTRRVSRTGFFVREYRSYHSIQEETWTWKRKVLQNCFAGGV